MTGSGAPTSPSVLDPARTRTTLERELADERRQRALATAVAGTLDVEQLLALLHQEIDRLGLFDGYLVNLVDRDGGALVCLRAHLPPSHAELERIYTGFSFELDDDDAWFEPYRTRRPVHVDADDAAEVGGLVHRAFTRWEASSMVVLPVTDVHGAIGTVVAYRRNGALDRDAVAHLAGQLTLFTNQLRHALTVRGHEEQSAEVDAALEDHRRMLTFVSKVTELSSPHHVHGTLLDEFLRLYRFDLGYLLLADEGDLVLRHLSTRRPETAPRAERLRPLLLDPFVPGRDAGVVFTSFEQNQPILIPDAAPLRAMEMDPRDAAQLDALEDPRTILYVPIRQHGAAIGVLLLFSLGDVRTLLPDELRVVELLGSVVGTAIMNARLYNVVADQNAQIEALNRELRNKVGLLDEMVRHDQLTGLQNFGTFHAELTRRIDEVSRHGGDDGVGDGLSVALVDVDHFKVFNDTYGHLAGNDALRELADRIADCVRTMDVPCRFGGEEFVVILPRCDIDGALRLAERVRACVADTPFVVAGEDVDLTISVGCATFRPGDTVDGLVHRADAALYRAKDLGRNRVEAAH